MRIALSALAILIAASTTASAQTCGHYMRAKFGLPVKYGLARAWLDLPRTSAQPGAIVVQSRRGRAIGGSPGGHVSRIVQMQDRCRAIVNDNAGTYSRDICKNLLGYVMPRGARTWSWGR